MCFSNSGTHLENCDNFVCPSSTYKCPSSYCIKLGYLCDGQWDCPSGYDEIACGRSSSPGYYKCKGSSIFISLENVCDETIPDCPLLDDEQLCQLNKPKCPDENCKCLLLAVTCSSTNGLPLPPLPKILPYISLFLKHVIFPSHSFPKSIVNRLPDIKYLSIINCSLSSFKLITHRVHKNLEVLNLDKNRFSKLGRNTIGLFSNLSILSVANNRLIKIKCHSFLGHGNNDNNYFFNILDLSNNVLTHFEDCTFLGIKSIQYFDILGNSIFTLGENVFKNLAITRINTSSYIVCCIVLHCNVTMPWPFSCGALFPHASMRAATWIIGLFGLISNVIVILIRMYSFKNGINPAFSVCVLSVAVADLCYCLSLVLLAIFDGVYGSGYATLDYMWRKSSGCHTVAFLFLFSSYLSIFAITILAISRYDVVRKPILSNFKDPNFCVRIEMPGVFIVFSMTIIIIFLYLSLESGWQLETGLCFLAGQSKNGFLQSMTTISLVILQIVGTCLLSFFYGLLVHKVFKQKLEVQSTQQVKDKTMLKIVVFTCITNVICWIPSACVFMITLTVKQYSYKLLVWTIITVLSLNAIMNPFILSRDTLKSLCL